MRKNYLNRLPAGMLPIALCPGGDLICLNMDKELFGKIFFWDHEHECLNNELYLVADTFLEFLRSFSESSSANIDDTVKDVRVEIDWEKLKNR